MSFEAPLEVFTYIKSAINAGTREIILPPVKENKFSLNPITTAAPTTTTPESSGFRKKIG